MSFFSQITERVFTGGEMSAGPGLPPDVSGVDALAAAGVTHVIDCRDDFDDAPLLTAHPAILYLWNGTADDGRPKPSAWFARSLAFALPMFAQPRTKLYCHCQAGINRGPSTAYAVLRALGFGRAEMLALIRLKRPVTLVGIRYADDADKAIADLGY